MIDLHTHSNASDGTDTPAELVAVAAAAGVQVLALTDHDTTRGWDEAVAALPTGLTLIRGAELSCVAPHPSGWPISLHLLGYLFDPLNPAFVAERARLRESRVSRARMIVESMAADGLPVTWERVEELADGGSVGRPHIARVLVENGAVESVTAAFSSLLGNNSPYYVGKDETGLLDAIAMVRAAGGVTVFAHPLARRRGRTVGDDVIEAMAAAGLGGIEVDHPDHSEPDRVHLRGLAKELGLFVTGSSDYHGTNKTTPIAACHTAGESYEALVSASTSAIEPITG
jgi:predicted metal-dependent phosphoesterase TrpH